MGVTGVAEGAWSRLGSEDRGEVRKMPWVWLGYLWLVALCTKIGPLGRSPAPLLG